MAAEPSFKRISIASVQGYRGVDGAASRRPSREWPVRWLEIPVTRTRTVNAARAFGKRAFDVVFALLALVLLAPLFLLIALSIKAMSPGDVIFSQVRVGQNGRRFRCHKFRTMVPNAHWVLEQDDDLRASYANSWKLVRDPRVTPIGRILRKTSLDELPQFWNVLKGDMSIVGPRPVQPDELHAQYDRYAATVTSVKPGITGLWQVSGRSSVSYQRRIALDIVYVKRRSLLFDLLIVAKTIPAILFCRGAH